jgi:hypothetical protein
MVKCCVLASASKGKRAFMYFETFLTEGTLKNEVI